MANAFNQDSPELIERLRTPGECRAAFGQVMRIYAEPLYRQIRRLVTSHEDADDILQNTFLKAWQSLEYFRGDARLGTWLYKIAINESLTFLAREKRRTTLSLDDPDSTVAHSAAADTELDSQLAAKLLHEAIQTLPEKQRLVFSMRYYDEMKYEDISEILGTSVGALKASYHLAVKKIEKYVEDNS